MTEQRESLATKYRPFKFSDVVGQTATAAVLNAMVRRGTVPHALLFAGQRGCGKTSCGRILGAALNCAEAKAPCGECASCQAVAQGTSLDVLEVDAASNGSVENIRRIREQVLYGTGGEYRVVLLDEAHSMSKDAFNAILKILEEPPPRTIFVLLTTERGKILPTVASRCMTFIFDPISPAAISGRLAQICQAEDFMVEDDLLNAIAQRADGAMRDAVMLLDQVSSVGITTLEMWQKLSGETDFAPALLDAAANGDHDSLFAQLDQLIHTTGDYGRLVTKLVTCLRDILVLTSGGSVAAQGEALEARQRLADRLGPAPVISAMKVLWELQTKVRVEDRRSSLELAAVMVSERLAGKRVIVPAVARPEQALLSEVKTLLGA